MQITETSRRSFACNGDRLVFAPINFNICSSVMPSWIQIHSASRTIFRKNDTIELDITKKHLNIMRKFTWKATFLLQQEKRSKTVKSWDAFTFFFTFTWNSYLKTEMHHWQHQHFILNRFLLESRRIS